MVFQVTRCVASGMPIGIAQHRALRVGEAEPSRREIDFSICPDDWPRCLRCLTAIIWESCRFDPCSIRPSGTLLRTLLPISLVLLHTKPSQRPHHGFAYAQ